MDMDKVLNKIYDYIDDHRDDMLKTLKEYINFRPVNTEQLLEGETTEMVACQQGVSQELEKTDYFSKVDYYEKAEGRPNVVGVREGNGNGRSLHFNAHTDVVTVSQEQAAQWSMLSPFDGGVKDGKVWGRGASDMKAGGTAMLHAAKALAAHDVQLKGDSIHICNRYKAIWPQRNKEDQVGVNAIDKMVKIINAFSELERFWGLEYNDPSLDPGATTVTVSMIKGGESFSAQAGECEMTIASMFVPQLSIKDIKKQLMDTIDYVSSHDHWLKNHRPKVNVSFPGKEPLNVSEKDAGITVLANAYEQVLGKPPKVGPGFFVGDANYLFEKRQKCI